MTFWKKTQLSPIGLDLASTAVRGVQLWRQGETIGVHSALEVQFDEVILADEETSQHDEKRRDAISRLIDLGGFKGSNVLIHCPVEKLAMRPISLPSGPEGLPHNTILGVLRHQLSEYISYPIDQAVIDYSILEHDTQAKQLKVMTITADGNWIEQQIRLLRSLKLNCIAVDPMPFTLSRLMPLENHLSNRSDDSIVPNAEDELIAILDIGYTGTTLVAIHGRKPVFCRRFTLGAREMTRTLSQHLMIDPVQAERLKVAFGFYYHAEETRNEPSDHKDQGTDLHIGKTIFTALQARLDEFTEGIIRSLNYVISQQRGARMTKLLLSGTASHTHHLDAYLADQLEIPVEPVSSATLNDIIQALPASRATSGTWCVATGLALTAFANSRDPKPVKESVGPRRQNADKELVEVG